MNKISILALATAVGFAVPAYAQTPADLHSDRPAIQMDNQQAEQDATHQESHSMESVRHTPVAAKKSLHKTKHHKHMEHAKHHAKVMKHEEKHAMKKAKKEEKKS